LTIRSRLVLVAALAVADLGLVGVLSIARAPSRDANAPRQASPAAVGMRLAAPATTLAQLGLSETQRDQIGRLEERERRRIDAIERTLAKTEQELRRAELVQPFDAERVGELVARRAELAAYLRGTESRIVAEIAGLLTPDQQRRLWELRVGSADAAPPARAPGETPLAASASERVDI
jgi:Spy/CpxP family protein refolding chaperone